MEEHLRTGCEHCRRSYEAAMETMTALACEVPQVEPSGGIAEALRRRMAEPVGVSAPVGPGPQVLRMEPRLARRPSLPWSPVLPWSIAAALALTTLWLGLSLRRESQELARSRANPPVLPIPKTVSPPPVGNLSGEAAPVATKVAAPSGVKAAGPPAAKDAAQVRALAEQVAALQAERDAAVARWNEAQSSLAQAVAARGALQAQLAAAQEQAASRQSRPGPSGEVQDAHRDATQLADLNGQLNQANATIAGLRGAVARDGRILAFFRAGPSRQIDLKSIDAGAGGAAGVAYYAPDRGLMVLVRNLPPLPGSECYQLWSVHKSGTAIASVGLMATDGAGAGYLFAAPSSDLRQLSALAITDEPKGGSISARGRKLLFGTLD